MIKRLLDGFVFGIGFAIAFVIIWAIAASFITSKMRASMARQPTFDHPNQAQIVEPNQPQAAEQHPAGINKNRDFSFFKNVESPQLKMPDEGGILSMSPVTTPHGSKRPSTYQLWLTGTKLWQIRTTEEKVETEKLPYPANATMTGLDRIMGKSLGFQAQQSTMTVSSEELRQLKATGVSPQDESMNGKLRITADGIVFVEPNPYGK